MVNDGGDSVHRIVMGSQPKLCHGDKVVSGNVHVYPLCDDFFHQLAGTLQQADGPVCLGEAVVRLVRFVEDDHHGALPQVGPQV